MKEILLKIISFILLLIIWPVSGIGIDEDYYTGAGWHYVEDDFYNSCFDSLNSTIEQLAEMHGLDVTQEVVATSADTIAFALYNNEFYCKLRFTSHYEGDDPLSYLGIDYNMENAPFGFLKSLDHGKYRAEMYFFSDSSEDLHDYNAQKKYVEFFDEITYLAAYDVDEGAFKSLFDEGIESSPCRNEKTLYEDDLVGTLQYYTLLNWENHWTEINPSEKCNRYVFYGLMKGSFYDSLKATE